MGLTPNLIINSPLDGSLPTRQSGLKKTEPPLIPAGRGRAQTQNVIRAYKAEMILPGRRLCINPYHSRMGTSSIRLKLYGSDRLSVLIPTNWMGTYTVTKSNGHYAKRILSV